MMAAIENVINQLKHYTERATSDGETYEFQGWADGSGFLSDERQDNGFRVQCWWDESDPSNPGWAYRAAKIEDGERLPGQEESGEL